MSLQFLTDERVQELSSALTVDPNLLASIENALPPFVPTRNGTNGNGKSNGRHPLYISTAPAIEMPERDFKLPTIQVMRSQNAPSDLIASAIADAAYRRWSSEEKERVLPIKIWEERKNQVGKALLDAGVQDIRENTIKRWFRLISLNAFIHQDFEKTCNENGLLLGKLVRDGLPTVYYGQDRESSAKLSATYALTIAKHIPSFYAIFACDSTNLDVYRHIRESSSPFIENIFLATHLDEYVLKALELASSPHSFALNTHSEFDRLGIHPKVRYLLNGLRDDPEAMAAEMRALFQLLHEKRKLGLAILGLGPRDCPHVAYLDHAEPLFTQSKVADLSRTTIDRNIGRGEPGEEKALTVGTVEILRSTFIQQTFFPPKNNEPSKVDGLIRAMACPLSDIPPTYSTTVSRFVPSRWVLITTESMIDEMLKHTENPYHIGAAIG